MTEEKDLISNTAHTPKNEQSCKKKKKIISYFSLIIKLPGKVNYLLPKENNKN